MSSAKKKRKELMSRPTLTFLGLMVFYGLVYFSEYKWWVIVLAPVQAAIIMVAIVFAPKVHKWVFGERVYKIEVNKEMK